MTRAALAAILLLIAATPGGAQSAGDPLDGVAALIDTGRYSQALERAALAERGSADPILKARIELTRGAVWQARGFARPAVDHFERARTAAAQAANAALLADAYGALASAYGDLGRWDRVLDFAERQRETFPQHTPATEFRYQFLRGTAFFEFQDREQAEVSLRQALVAARSTGDARSISMALGEIAGLALEFDRDVARALAAYDEALDIARQGRLKDLEATWLLDSATAMREGGDYGAARKRFESALTVAQAAGTRRITPAARKNLAQVLLKEGDRPAAVRLLTLAEREADEQNLPQLRWEIRIERAVLAQAGDPDEAERLFDEALDILEDTQGSVLVEQLRTGALRRALAFVDPYDLAIDFLMARGKDVKAFEIAERGRARAFLEALRLADDRIARSLPPEYLEAEATLLSDISEGQAALRAATLSAADRRAVQIAIQADEERLNALRLRLNAEQPAVAAARFARLWTVEALQRERLAPNQGLGMFFLGSRTSFFWIVTRNALRSVRLAPGAQVESVARKYLDQARTAAAAGEPALAEELFGLLVPDASALEGIEHLTVVPHGILYNVPFEALRDTTGRRLIERLLVEYAPSASSFALLAGRERPSAPAAAVLGVGNPVMTGRDAAATRRVGLEHLALLEPLPFTGSELDAIEDLFGRAARLLEGAGATERALRETDLSSVAVLHFATHGLIDENHPERSALVLTAQPPEDDGVLQVREVYGLHLQDALVTLSACDTALGQNVRGEGMLGLSRAFFYAGANSVVASLWSVNDRSAAAFMQEFYSGLGEGLNAAAALRRAKLKFLKEEADWSAPYHWAAFIVVGNGRWAGAPAAAPPSLLSRVAPWLALLTTLGAVLRAGITWRRRRARRQAAAQPS